MKISVALCTYNGERYLRQQLDSLAAQTRAPDELVVCDDCSRDRTTEIVREFAARAPFPVRLHVNEQNLRVVKNFEKAVALCAGDIVAMCDQDDVWLPEKLEVFERIFAAKPNVGLVFCDAEIVDENLNRLGYSNWDISKLNNAAQTLFTNKNTLEKSFERLVARPVVWGCMAAFRARYKDLVLPIPVDIPGVLHDWWLSWMVFAVSNFEPVADRLVLYRQHSAQQYGQEPFETESKPPTVAEAASNTNDYAEQIERMRFILERLRLKADDFAVAPMIEFIESRLRHCTHRQNIHHGAASRAERLRLIAADLFALRYHRHSSGLKSVVKDLLLP